MHVRFGLAVLLLVCLATNAYSAVIYKCMVDGRLVFSDQPCTSSGGSIVTLNELAAPLVTFDMNKAAQLDYTIKSHVIKERIARHRHKIDHYTARMNTALKTTGAASGKQNKTVIRTSADQSLINNYADSLRPSGRRQATASAATLEVPDNSQSINKISGVLEDQLGNIANAIKRMNQETVSGQKRAVIEHYSTLIKTEEFKIGLLMQELKLLRE